MEKLLVVLAALFFIFAIWLASVLVFFFAWNYVAAYFGFKLITVWVAAAIMSVVGLLTGGLRK